MITRIFQMLFEIAIGNFTFRVVPEGNNEVLDKIALLLNSLAEEKQAELEASDKLMHKKTQNTHIFLSTSDTLIIQKVLDYIVNHLEDPLPTTKELSKMFGTNECTLKNNFRNVLHTSIYQLYTTLRLKRAHILIQQSSLSLKEIAFCCGFNNYVSFYLAFKKHFGYSPNKIIP